MKVFGHPAKQGSLRRPRRRAAKLFGIHPDFPRRARQRHQVLGDATFTPDAGASSVSRAAHLKAPVKATIRFSNSTGVPVIPDADPNATPKGLAIRFFTSSGDTDIVAHSANGFPGLNRRRLPALPARGCGEQAGHDAADADSEIPRRASEHVEIPGTAEAHTRQFRT